MTTKSTPDPWQALNPHGYHDQWVIARPKSSPNGIFATRLDNGAGVFTKADAHLLAAAPDLLEALHLIDGLAVCPPKTRDDLRRKMSAIARAALALTQPKD